MKLGPVGDVRRVIVEPAAAIGFPIELAQNGQGQDAAKTIEAWWTAAANRQATGETVRPRRPGR